MKKLFITCLVVFFLFGVSISSAQDISIDKGGEFGFTWDANIETDMAGYRLYRSSTSGGYSYGEAFAYAVFGLVTESPKYTEAVEGTYYFVLTAVDDEGLESLPSIEQTLTVENMPPSAPSGCAILKF